MPSNHRANLSKEITHLEVLSTEEEMRTTFSSDEAYRAVLYKPAFGQQWPFLCITAKEMDRYIVLDRAMDALNEQYTTEGFFALHLDAPFATQFTTSQTYIIPITDRNIEIILNELIELDGDSKLALSNCLNELKDYASKTDIDIRDNYTSAFLDNCTNVLDSSVSKEQLDADISELFKRLGRDEMRCLQSTAPFFFMGNDSLLKANDLLGGLYEKVKGSSLKETVAEINDAWQNSQNIPEEQQKTREIAIQAPGVMLCAINGRKAVPYGAKMKSTSQCQNPVYDTQRPFLPELFNTAVLSVVNIPMDNVGKRWLIMELEELVMQGSGLKLLSGYHPYSQHNVPFEFNESYKYSVFLQKFESETKEQLKNIYRYNPLTDDFYEHSFLAYIPYEYYYVACAQVMEANKVKMGLSDEMIVRVFERCAELFIATPDLYVPDVILNILNEIQRLELKQRNTQIATTARAEFEKYTVNYNIELLSKFIENNRSQSASLEFFKPNTSVCYVIDFTGQSYLVTEPTKAEEMRSRLSNDEPLSDVFQPLIDEFNALRAYQGNSI